MPAVLPPVLNLARRGQPLAPALTIAVLAVPLVIVTVALIPALIICPFLTAAHREQVTRAAGQPAAVDGHTRQARPSAIRRAGPV